jgi:hypothetical protein
MTDSTPAPSPATDAPTVAPTHAPSAPSAPSAPLAPPPEPDGRYDDGGGSNYAPQSSGTPAPAMAPQDTRAALDGLNANEKWRADFSGENGREAQRHAVAHKAQVVQQSEVWTEPANTSTEGLTPGDYKFQFEGTRTMAPEVYAAMHKEVSEIAHALGADPHAAKATVEYLDQFMLNNPNAEPPADAETFKKAINQRFGADNTVIEDAKRAVLNIPEGPGRQRLLNAFDRLDTNTSLLLIGKLAGLGRNLANG